MSDVLGRLSGDDTQSETFWRAAFDDAGTLVTPRRGAIWEAVMTAHDLGQRGAGRLVAILDGHFDPSALPADRVAPESDWGVLSPDPRKRHGTIVARLVAAAAPDARLLLLSVLKGERPSQVRVATAIDRAVALGADVINMSLEFSSDCAPRGLDWVDSAVQLALDPQPEAFLHSVDEWLAHGEPYEGARCARACPVCEALSHVPASTAVIAAAGNTPSTLVCPACFSDVVGVGFERSMLTVDESGSVVSGPTVLPNAQNLMRGEIFVDVPVGFEWTSFASPLLAGLAAVSNDPADFKTLVRFPLASTPLAQLGDMLRRNADAVPERSITTLHAGLLRFAEAVPEAHRHWRQDTIHPCALCSLFLRDWYLAWVTLLVNTSSAGAGAAARVAVAVSPRSSLNHANVGVALRESGQPHEAAPWFGRAADLAPNAAVAEFYRGLQRDAER